MRDGIPANVKPADWRVTCHGWLISRLGSGRRNRLLASRHLPPRANRRAAIECIIDADPVAACVRDIMAERSSWTGSAAELCRPVVAAAMQIAVVDAAQRHSVLVPDLATKCARLPKLNVVGIGRATASQDHIVTHNDWGTRGR